MLSFLSNPPFMCSKSDLFAMLKAPTALFPDSCSYGAGYYGIQWLHTFWLGGQDYQLIRFTTELGVKYGVMVL